MVSTSDLCTPPGDFLPVPKESLVQEEMADVSKLPFAADSGREMTEAARAVFKELIAGTLLHECDTFLTSNNIAVNK